VVATRMNSSSSAAPCATSSSRPVRQSEARMPLRVMAVQLPGKCLSKICNAAKGRMLQTAAYSGWHISSTCFAAE
jgi:hypothetical protein